MVSGLRTVELSGSPRAMGEAFGEQFRGDIQRFTHSRIERLAGFVLEHRRPSTGSGRHEPVECPERPVAREHILGLAHGTIDIHRSFDPAIWEESCAIARAAGLTIEELLIGNGFTDFRDFVLFEEPTSREHLGECTAFLVPADCTDGSPIVGQTWDMNANARDFLAVVHRRPDDAPETLGLTTVGCLCLIGMNSEGVAVGNTNLIPTDARAGVHYLFTITHALRCGSAVEAADAIEATPRLSGHNYYIADPTTAINLETTARQAARTNVEGSPFVHANHYLAESLKPLEFTGGGRANSRQRHQGLQHRFDTLVPPITVDDCWAQLAHITQGRDDPDFRDPAAVATVAAVVMCPGERKLHVCAGFPQAGNAEVLSL